MSAMEFKYGTGMRYFFNTLPAADPKTMKRYLERVKIYADLKAKEVPSLQVMVDHWKKQKSAKE